MNKIFKVIFNKSTQTWTAVSELSKANGKSSTKVDKRANLSAGKVRVVAATLVVSVVSNTVVSAASTSSNGGIKAGTASGEDSIAIGEGSKAGTNGSKGAIAIGKDSKAIAGATIAIGRGAQNLSAGNSIAFGSGAKTYSNYSISIGDEAEAGKIMSVLDSVGYYKSNIIENAIAIGRKARAINESTVAIGHSASGLGEYAIALGHKAEAGNAGWGAIAIGAQAQAIAGAAIAIGRGAMNQSLGNSIAFGSDAHTYSGYSIAIGNLAQAGIPITGTKHTLGYYDNGHSNAVAIGNKATAIGEGSIALGKDANTKTKYSIVLGAEAQSSREEFNDGEGSVVIGYKAKEINHLLVGMGEGKNNIIIGREALSAGNNVVGIGYQANAWSPNSVAIGNKAQALGAGNTVGSDVAIGDSAISYNQDAIALGHGAKAGIEWTKTTWDKNTDAPNYAVGSKGAIAIGANAKAIAGATIAIGRDAQNLSSGNSIAFGSNTKTYSGYSIAIGDQAQAGTKGTQNSDAKYYTDSQTESAVAIGQNARATHLKAIALGADSQTGDYVNAKDSTKTTLMFNDHQNQAISVSSFKFAGSDNGNNQRYVLSVGNNALKRQIQNVAAGIISESSTDAINGSQLYYVAQNVGFNIQRNGTPVSRVNNNHIVNFKDSTPNITASVAEKGNQTDIEIKLSDHLKVKDIVTESLTATGDITVSEINAGSIIASDIEASEATFENALTVNSGPTVLGGSLQVEGESIFKGKVIFDGGVEVRKVVKNITTVNSTDFEVGGEAKFKDHVDFEAGATVYGELNVDDVVATGTVNANNLEAATAQISNLTVNEKIEARKGVDLGIGSGEVAEHETRAVSGEVVARAIEEVKNTGFKVKAKDGETHTIKSGDVLTFDATQEMTVDQTNGTVTYGLATPVLDTLKAAQARTDSGVVGGNTTDSTGKQVEGALALGKDSIALGTNSMAMGFTATASANGAIATGVNSKASGSDSTAIGANSQATEEQSTATGQNAQATGNNATASGANSKATADGATASGAGSQAMGEQSTATGMNAKATAKGATANGADSQATGENSTVVGHHSTVAGENATAFGSENTVNGKDSGAFGHNNSVETDNSYALGNNIKQTLANSVFLGSDSGYVSAGESSAGNESYSEAKVGSRVYQFAGGKASEVAGVVSVGNKGANRRIQNVAPGLIAPHSTDAVNGSQLYAVVQGLSNELGMKVQEINSRIQNVDNRLQNGIASAVAAASLVQAYNPSDSLFAIGVGSYRGRNALAIGYSKVSDSGKVIFKVTGSVNQFSDYTGGASIGFKF